MNGRIRSLKPEWLDDEVLGGLDDATRLLSVALILMADDYGNGRAAPVFIAGRVWSYAVESLEAVSRKTLEGLARLSRVGFIELYLVNGQHYFHIRNWAKHQRVDKPSRPTCPGPERADPSRDPRESLVPDRIGIGEEILSGEGPTEFLLATGTEPGDRQSPLAAPDPASFLAAEAIAYLNAKMRSHYQPDAKQTLADMRALAKDGFTVEQARRVIDAKIAEWSHKPDMAKYLRPSSLFRPTNFRRYVVDVEGAPGATRNGRGMSMADFEAWMDEHGKETR